MTRERGDLQKASGPGILYAATAVGASHLVQSTRAGADYGLALTALIALTFVAKYPAFRFGAHYASVTGTSLLDGYRNQGRWAVSIYAVVAIGTMFAAIPAVTLVTAGLAKAAFGLPSSTFSISAVILAGCVLILVGGGYTLLDRLVKVLMAVLAVATLAATALAIPGIDWQSTATLLPPDMTPLDVFFIVALLGLMPSSVDISVWHSLWSEARAKETAHRPSLNAALFDFHVGYAGAFVLALCFVLLGTGIMHDSGVRFASGAAAFATQLIDLYRQTLGPSSGPLIGVVALAVMLSTVLTGLDGYPRAAVSLLRQSTTRDLPPRMLRTVYAASLLVLVIGSLVIMYFFVTSLKVVVDIAATLMFLFAPAIAWLNHRVVCSADLPAALRPGRAMRALSWAGIAWMGAFSIFFLYLRATS